MEARVNYFGHALAGKVMRHLNSASKVLADHPILDLVVLGHAAQMGPMAPTAKARAMKARTASSVAIGAVASAETGASAATVAADGTIAKDRGNLSPLLASPPTRSRLPER